MLKSYRVGWGGVVVGWYKILVSAPVPLELILTGFDWVGAGPWGFWVLGRGLTISNTLVFVGWVFSNAIDKRMICSTSLHIMTTTYCDQLVR